MARLEIASFSVDSAVAAWQAGCDRIELCDDRDSGGTTPSKHTVWTVKRQVSVPVFVMIRPRGGDFVYTDEEFDEMKASIDQFKPDIDGFVFGILDENNEVDVERTAELVKKAHPVQCTFHRAIDETQDMLQALEDIITSGCRYVLSSGGAVDASSGADMLRKLIERANGRIAVIPGGGVRAKNIDVLRRTTKAEIFHSSAIPDTCTELQASEVRRMKELLGPDTNKKPDSNGSQRSLDQWNHQEDGNAHQMPGS